jgi:hypothetical protein
MWRIDPLLGKYLNINETTAVAMQQIGKHGSILFSIQSVQSGYKKDNWGDPVS